MGYGSRRGVLNRRSGRAECSSAADGASPSLPASARPVLPAVGVGALPLAAADPHLWAQAVNWLV
jgi:hypothetical protein